MTDLADIADVGRDRGKRGGYSRHGFAAAELTLRAWFAAAAVRLGLEPGPTGNGNIWAWWDEPGRGPDAVVTGTHLDSVPGGGAFDGPLGVGRRACGGRPAAREGRSRRRPLTIVVFAEEEGGRFGLACLGSRLMTGARSRPRPACRLVDSGRRHVRRGRPRRRVRPAAGWGADGTAPLSSVGVFVELHVEQGRGLDVPVGLASSILAHGRLLYTFRRRGQPRRGDS